MKDTASQVIILRMLGGVILGAILGASLGTWLPREIAGINLVGTLDVIGSLFLNALTVIIFPLIITMIIVGITNLADYRKLGAIAYKTFGYFIATSGIAVVVGLLLAIIFGPGRGEIILARPLPEGLAPQQIQSVGEFLKTLIPTNLIAAASGGSYLGLIIFALVFAAILTTMANRARTVVSFFRAVHEVLMRIVGLVVWLAPIGLIGLVGSMVARHNRDLAEIVSGLGMLSLVVVIGLLIHLAVILPVLLRTYALQSPALFFRNLLPSLFTAFGTRSSAATLPVLYRNVTDDNDIDSRAGSFVLPLATTLNMNGSALFLAAGAVYIAQVSGLQLSIFGYLAVAVGSLVVSFALAGVPTAALFGLVAVAAIGGFREQALAALGVLIVVDWFLDGLRTAVNVAGDAVGAAVIGEVFEFKTVGRKGARDAEARTAREPRPDRGRGRGRDRRKTSERPQKDARRGRRDRRDDQRGSRQDRRKGSDRREEQSQRDERKPDRRSQRDRRHQQHSRQEDRSRDQKPQAPAKPEPQKAPETPKEKDSSTEREQQRKPKPDNVVMSQQTIEEELKRVREQLSSSPKVEPTKPEEVETEHQLASELPEEEPVRTDHAEKQEQKKEPTAGESADEGGEPDRTEDSADEARDETSGKEAEEKRISYGRGRGRRGKSAKSDETKSDVPGPVKKDEGEESPEPQDSYDTDNMSFGRGKRKK